MANTAPTGCYNVNGPTTSIDCTNMFTGNDPRGRAHNAAYFTVGQVGPPNDGQCFESPPVTITFSAQRYVKGLYIMFRRYHSETKPMMRPFTVVVGDRTLDERDFSFTGTFGDPTVPTLSGDPTVPTPRFNQLKIGFYNFENAVSASWISFTTLPCQYYDSSRLDSNGVAGPHNQPCQTTYQNPSWWDNNFIADNQIMTITPIGSSSSTCIKPTTLQDYESYVPLYCGQINSGQPVADCLQTSW